MSRREGKPRSSRTREREAARAAEKLLKDRRRLASLQPGGMATNPWTVESASLVEPMATSNRCLRCNESVRLKDHRVVAQPSDAGILRQLDVVCPWCGEERTYWMRVVVQLPS